MDNSRIIYLYERFNSRAASPEEVQEFNMALADPATAQVIKTMIDEQWEMLTEDQAIDVSEDRVDPIFAEITAQPQEQVKRRKLWPRIAVAASILIALSTGLYFYRTSISSRPAQGDLPPGKNVATLTLDNGKQIVLSAALKGNVAEESGITITKTEAGEIIYQVTEPAKSAELHYNILSTGKGEAYQIRLPDGSKVWLNAESSLKYPVSFTSLKERKVELTGEGYFEVTHNKAMPFIVKTDRQSVTVLGTHFNINSYTDENAIRTTLLEGSVRVTGEHAEELVLKPNQQAVYTADYLHIHDVEANEFAAWKDGKFAFDKEQLSSIMRKVARWYNIAVVYQGDVADVRLTGSISKFEHLYKFLDMLENTKEVHFKIEGKKIIVIRN